MPLKLTSPPFEDGAVIQKKYAQDGCYLAPNHTGLLHAISSSA